MDIKEAVKEVALRFEYKEDNKFIDTWSVMREKRGKLKGDCDDFALTCVWYACDRNIFKFIWHVLILHRYRFYKCKTYKGVNHLIGYAQGKWFDNWTLEALDKDQFLVRTQHQVRYFYVLPIMWLQLVLGIFARYLH